MGQSICRTTGQLTQAVPFRASASSIANAALSGADTINVTAVKAGKVIYTPGGTFGPRVQRDLQIVLLHTGAMHVNIDGADLSVPAGHMTLLEPGHIEEFAFSTTQETWHRWIAVTVESVPEVFLKRLSELPEYIPISDRMNRIVDLLLLLEVSGLDCARTQQDLGHAALMLFISEAEHHQTKSTLHPAVTAVKEYVEKHYAQPLVLTQLANIADLTPEHLIHLFQKHEGITPMKYLWRFRVRKGIELLRNTGLSIGEIAEKIGFKTSYHFARVIKQLTGKTASEVRRESWEEQR